MSEELKPCPFCGSQLIEIIATFLSTVGHIDDWLGSCDECYARSEPCETAEEAIEAWNRRD